MSKADKKSKDSKKLKVKDTEIDEEDEVIDLCDDHDYQVLSAVFETDSGKNIADILSRLQKDVHLLAMSVHQIIQLSLASHSVKQDESDKDSENHSQSEESDS
jgi:hypothetical protein